MIDWLIRWEGTLNRISCFKFPAAEFPAAELPGAELPGAEFPAAEFPAAESPTSNFLLKNFLLKNFLLKNFLLHNFLLKNFPLQNFMLLNFPLQNFLLLVRKTINQCNNFSSTLATSGMAQYRGMWTFSSYFNQCLIFWWLHDFSFDCCYNFLNLRLLQIYFWRCNQYSDLLVIIHILITLKY